MKKVQSHSAYYYQVLKVKAKSMMSKRSRQTQAIRPSSSFSPRPFKITIMIIFQEAAIVFPHPIQPHAMWLSNQILLMQTRFLESPSKVLWKSGLVIPRLGPLKESPLCFRSGCSSRIVVQVTRKFREVKGILKEH